MTEIIATDVGAGQCHIKTLYAVLWFRGGVESHLGRGMKTDKAQSPAFHHFPAQWCCKLGKLSVQMGHCSTIYEQNAKALCTDVDNGGDSAYTPHISEWGSPRRRTSYLKWSRSRPCLDPLKIRRVVSAIWKRMRSLCIADARYAT